MNNPATITHARLRVVASMIAPAGAAAIIPAIPPSVLTAPITPVLQPRPSSKTPKKGPIPACISAMKKFTACSAARSPAPPRGTDVCALTVTAPPSRQHCHPAPLRRNRSR